MLETGMRFFVLLLTVLAVFFCGCEKRPQERYVDKRYLFSFIPPKGWTVTAEQTPACLTSVEARNGSCRMYICVSERPEEFLPTTSDFANCELVKLYVTEKLKGYKALCRPSIIQGRRCYDAIYLRNVADEAGGVRLQLVRQTFIARDRLLYTLTSYVFGQSEEELKNATSPCEDPVLRSEMTFFLHAPPY